MRVDIVMCTFRRPQVVETIRSIGQQRGTEDVDDEGGPRPVPRRHRQRVHQAGARQGADPAAHEDSGQFPPIGERHPQSM